MRFSRVYILFIHRSFVSFTFTSSSCSQKSSDRFQRARREGLSHLSFVLSFENHQSRLLLRVSPSRRPSQKSEKKESPQSVVFLFFSAKTDTKKTQKNEKNLTTFTLTLTTTTNDNIKTVWRAWMNSKSPKAEETKGTEI